VIDTFEDITVEGMSGVRKKVEQRAIDKAVAAGADPLTTTVVESEAIPIACKSIPVSDGQHLLISCRHDWPMSILRKSSRRLDRLSHSAGPPFCVPIRPDPTRSLRPLCPITIHKTGQPNHPSPSKRPSMDSNQYASLQTHNHPIRGMGPF
jgi:hypothetical protein